MTDLHNLHGFERDTDSEPTERSSSPTVATVPLLRRMQHQPIGFVTEISGGGSQIQIEGQRLRELSAEERDVLRSATLILERLAQS